MLATTRRVLTWLYMIPTSKSESFKKKLSISLVALIVFLANASDFMSHFAFFWKFLLIDTEKCLLAFMGVSGTVGLLYASVSAFLMRYKMNVVFEKLSAIYNSSLYRFSSL